MISTVVDAALRSLLVGGVLWVGIAVLRITDPRREKIIWVTLLAGALVMPALVHLSFIPQVAPLPYSAASVAVHNLSIDKWSPSIGGLISVLYVSVSLLLLLRMAIGTGRMWRMRSNAQRVLGSWTLGQDVRVADTLPSPATFGATILLPRGYLSWSEAKRAMVLWHELAHVRNRDSLIQWLAGLHACLFWFSPLAWWLRRRLAQLAEYASDDEVLNRDIPRADYATVLFEEAETRAARPMLVSIASNSLERRVDRILCGQRHARPLSRGQRLFAVLAVVPLIALATEGAVAPSLPAGLEEEAHLEPYTEPPFIVAGPSNQDLRKYYPPEAAHRGIDGLVQITVTLDEAGRATDTRILKEEPSGLGFGAAASELAHHFRYSNPTRHPADVTYKVKFELNDRGS